MAVFNSSSIVLAVCRSRSTSGSKGPFPTPCRKWQFAIPTACWLAHVTKRFPCFIAAAAATHYFHLDQLFLHIALKCLLKLSYHISAFYCHDLLYSPSWALATAYLTSRNSTIICGILRTICQKWETSLEAPELFKRMPNSHRDYGVDVGTS